MYLGKKVNIAIYIYINIIKFINSFCFTYIVTNKSNNCIQKNGINIFGFPLMAP